MHPMPQPSINTFAFSLEKLTIYEISFYKQCVQPHVPLYSWQGYRNRKPTLLGFMYSLALLT